MPCPTANIKIHNVSLEIMTHLTGNLNYAIR